MDLICAADIGIYDFVPSNLTAYNFTRNPNNIISVIDNGRYNGTVYYWLFKNVTPGGRLSMKYFVNSTAINLHKISEIVIIGADPFKI